MSIVYKADIHCDGETADCAKSIEQAKVYVRTTVGLAVGAWKVAKGAGWTRSVVNKHFYHYCPACTAQRECDKDALHG